MILNNVKIIQYNGRGGLVVESSPCIQRIGVRFQIGTNVVVKIGSDSSTVKRSGTFVGVTGPNVSQQVWLKSPPCSIAMSMSAEYRTHFVAPIMLTSPHE